MIINLLIYIYSGISWEPIFSTIQTVHCRRRVKLHNIVIIYDHLPSLGEYYEFNDN